MAMKNSQLLFPIVNANASTLTTPLNFNHQNLGIKRQVSKDALCRHPCIWKDQRRGKGKAMKKQAWLFTIGGVLRQRYIHISGMTLLYSRSTYQYERPPQFYVARDSLWRAGVGNEIWHSNQDTRPDFFFQMSNKYRWKIRLLGVILSCLSWLEKFFCVFSSGGICRYAQKQHMSDKMRRDFHCRLFGYFSFPWRYFCISKKKWDCMMSYHKLFFVVHCQRLNSFY